jgi:hypothetical protein
LAPEYADKIQNFFCNTVMGRNDMVYELDGTIIEEKSLHPVAIIATNAQASLASAGNIRKNVWTYSGTRHYVRDNGVITIIVYICLPYLH